MSLAEQMEADLDAILLNDFGVEVLVTPAPWDDTPYLLQGLFDSPFVPVNIGALPAEMQDVRFSYRSSSANIYEGCTITINSVIYDVIRIEPDGQLICHFLLISTQR